MTFKLQQELKDFSNDDYLLLIGDPAIIAVCGAIAAKNKEAREFEAKVKAQMELLKVPVVAYMQENGATSIKTKQGNITLKEDKKFNTTNWDAFYTFVKEHDAFHFLNKRITHKAVQEFFEENDKVIYPIGLQEISEQNITVTKPRK